MYPLGYFFVDPDLGVGRYYLKKIRQQNKGLLIRNQRVEAPTAHQYWGFRKISCRAYLLLFVLLVQKEQLLKDLLILFLCLDFWILQIFVIMVQSRGMFLGAGGGGVQEVVVVGCGSAFEGGSCLRDGFGGLVVGQNYVTP